MVYKIGLSSHLPSELLPWIESIYLKVDVERPPAALFRGKSREEASAVVRERVVAARQRALDRQGVVNGRLPAAELDRVCELNDASWQLLENAVDSLGLSARAMHRMTRVARTIADLAGADRIASPHIAEALGFRGDV